MSSKFSRSPTPRLRPPICIKPFGSCKPPFPIAVPPELHSWLDLYDLDPLDPIGGSGYAHLVQISSEPRYFGWSADAPTQVGCEIWQTVVPTIWSLTATLLFPAHPPANYDFLNFFVDPTKDFDTGQLSHITVPALDYQKVRVMS